MCHWELCNENIVLSSQSSDLVHREESFKAAFTETKVRLEEKALCLLKSPTWLSFLESLQGNRAEYPIPVVLPEGCNIIIVDTPSNVTKTRWKLKNFFAENQLEEKTLKIDQNPLKFLYCTEEIKEVYKKAKGVGVSVNFNKTGMVAEGPKDNLPGTVREVKELLGGGGEFWLKFVEAVLNLRVVFTLSLQLPMDHIQAMPTATGPISQSRSFQERSQSQE